MRSSYFAVVAIGAVGCVGSVEQVDSQECTPGATESCALADAGPPGVRSCDATGSGPSWGSCHAPEPVGIPTAGGGGGSSGGTSTASSEDGGAPSSGGTGSSGTPLVLAFEGEDVTFTNARGAFDVFGAAASVGSRWVSAATPWLVLDRNGNGAIDDGKELFGSMTVLDDGTRAANGFQALAELDENGDGILSARDPIYAALRLWRDADQDRRSGRGELSTLAEEGIVSIDVGYRSEPRCDDGDCEVERGRFTYRDGQGTVRVGTVIDVHLGAR